MMFNIYVIIYEYAKRLYVYVYVDTRSHLGSRCSSCLLAEIIASPSKIASPFALAG